MFWEKQQGAFLGARFGEGGEGGGDFVDEFAKGGGGEVLGSC